MPPSIPRELENNNRAATLWRDVARLYEDYNDKAGFLKVVRMITSQLGDDSEAKIARLEGALSEIAGVVQTTLNEDREDK